MEGFPYGYHNFIFGWLDVPVGNFPAALSHELAMHIFAFAEKIAPAPIVQLVGEGLNKRLGTEGLTLNQIAIEAGKRGISLVIFISYNSLTYSQLLNKMIGFIVMDQVMFVHA